MRKLLLIALFCSCAATFVFGDSWTDPETGIEWSYFHCGAGDSEIMISDFVVPADGVVVFPSEIENKPVTSISVGYSSKMVKGKLKSVTMPSSVRYVGDCCFEGCTNLTFVSLSENLEIIGFRMFFGCKMLKSIVIPPSVKAIGKYPFNECSGLQTLTIPASVSELSDKSFMGCYNLRSLIMDGDAPDVGASLFSESSLDMVVYVKKGTKGWSDENGNLKKRWPYNTTSGRPLAYIGEEHSSDMSPVSATLTVTNVVVHYVLNSVQPNIAVPVSGDTGFVTVITEVKSSGAVSVPSEWSANYPSFATKYGSDFGKALMMKSGKKDGAGNDMFVWQDYVAGTDPTNPDDRFTASITLVDGVPVVSYSPELTPEQKALRMYKTLGKKQLQDKDWTDITTLPGEDMKLYNFFKVTVEMK